MLIKDAGENIFFHMAVTPNERESLNQTTAASLGKKYDRLINRTIGVVSETWSLLHKRRLSQQR